MLFTGTVGEKGKLVEYHLTVLDMVGAEMIYQTGTAFMGTLITQHWLARG